MESEKPFKTAQVQGMIKEFLCLDADGDGTITVDELEKVLRSMRGKSKPSEIEIKKAIKEIDRDGDGTIDMDEYVRSCRNKATQDLIHRALVQSSKIRKEFEGLKDCDFFFSFILGCDSMDRYSLNEK